VTAATLWIEERDEPVWHRVVARDRSLEYRAACGWELSAREGRVWPQKPNQPGPADELRCHTCVARAKT
jgi:hypothetical protein